MYKRWMEDWFSGQYISVASDEEEALWEKAQQEGKPYIVEYRYGYPHKLVFKKMDVRAPEKEVTPPFQKNG